MMRIAVASEGENVAEHFGHCEAFTIFDAEDGRILREEVVPNPGHKPGFLPLFLRDRGVTAVISGGMGGGAIDLFVGNKMDAVTGAAGNAAEAALAYARGTLVSTRSVCEKHEHHDECGGH